MNGKAIILSAPSASGKTTLVHYLIDKIPLLAFSVSATSRKQREEETNGKDYFFLTADEFRNKIEEDAFIEWEEVYEDCYYGTLKSEIERMWNEGKHVVFDVDVKGGLHLKKTFGEKALSVFVRPPSIQELKKRLEKRGTESEESLKKRIGKAEYEMAFANLFDVEVVNDDREAACREAEEIVKKFLNL
ncbi:MAG: guanylate kinase [Bacteroidota bacterium]